jgi:ATP-dependent protease ClpP protease subunit
VTPLNWFRFQNVADDASVVEIHVIDIIGDWIDELINEYYGMKATLTAKGFLEQLSKLDASVKTIRVRINSPGGDVFAALTIANALRDQQRTKGRTVETIVDGLAASAASIIAMAGKTVTMADNALMMIHAPWSLAMGNAGDMRKAAETLDAVQNTIVATYQWHSTETPEAIAALIEAETWMSADEAIAHGFATDKVEGLQAAALLTPMAVSSLKVPDQFKARVEALVAKAAPAPVAASAAEVLKACKAAGCLEQAEELVTAHATLEQVTAKIAEVKGERARVAAAAETARVAAEARVSAITGLCATAKHADLAADFIAGGMTVEGVRAALTKVTAKLDAISIDGSLNPDHGSKGVRAIDRTAIYRNFNKR